MKGIGERNNMEEWKEIKISDIGHVVTGKTPRTSIKENYGGYIPFLTPSDDLSNKFAPITNKALTDKGLMEVRNCLLPKNSICVSCIGSDLGKVVMLKKPTVTNQQFNSIIPNENYSPDFVYYLMIIVGKRLNFLSKTSTAVPIINKSTFSNFEVEVPSCLHKQTQIAKILSSLDDKIELNNRINTNLEEQAQTLFRRWFVDFEFPNEQGLPYKSNGGKFVDSELGKIPEGWKIGTLSEIADYLNGLAMQKFRPKDKELGIPVLKIKELGQKSCDSSSDICSESIKPEYIVNDGDVIFSWSGTLKIDIWCGGICGLNQHLFKVTSKIYPKWFYYYWTKQHLNKFIRIAKDKAVTMGHIKREDLDKSQLSIPNNKNFRTMNNIIGPLLEKQITLNIENRFLIQLRDAFLPKLMNNEIKI